MSKELVLSCRWSISINGKELDLNRVQCITSIEIQELCDGSDTCTISLSDPEFLFIEDNIFVEEATISITMGFVGGTNQVTFSGYISAIDLDFPAEGYPTMSIYCLDKSHLMNRKKKKRSWDNVTSADVVRKIAQEYGFKCVVEQGYSFTTQSTISQSGNTDIEFCESLAGNERDLFMCKLVGDTLYYVKKGLLKDPVATLAYKEYPYDVISFSPQINKETKQESVETADITDDKVIDTGVADDDTPRDTQGDSVQTDSSATPGYTYDYDTRQWVNDSPTATDYTVEYQSDIDEFWGNVNWEEYKGE